MLIVLAASLLTSALGGLNNLLLFHKGLTRGFFVWLASELANDLSEATGIGGCSMAVFTDVGLAAVFMAALAENEPSFSDTAQLLQARNEKALLRKKEAAIHRRKMSAGRPVGKAAQGKRRKKQ